MEVKRKIRKRKKNRLRAVSLFSVVRRAKRETRKWPRACLMARDGRGTRPRFARLAASPLPRACIALTKETARCLKKTDRGDLGTIQDPPFLGRAEQRLRMCLNGRGLGSNLVSFSKGFSKHPHFLTIIKVDSEYLRFSFKLKVDYFILY